MVSAKNVFVSSLVMSFVAVAAVLTLGSSSVSAQGTDNQSNDQQQNQQNTQTYDYVAQPGDSYSLIARKAVQTYGVINNVNLSPEQIIFVETNLTQKAGSPELNVGQKVQVQVSDIEAWVNKAKELSESQQNAWSVYADNANFNTNSVGQSS